MMEIPFPLPITARGQACDQPLSGFRMLSGNKFILRECKIVSRTEVCEPDHSHTVTLMMASVVQRALAHSLSLFLKLPINFLHPDILPTLPPPHPPSV